MSDTDSNDPSDTQPEPERQPEPEPQLEPQPQRTRSGRGIRAIGVLVVLAGVILAVAGVISYVAVQQTLADENITVSDDADYFAGEDVTGPLTAYSQASVIAEHAEGIADGQTYAELPQDDPRRPAVMDASFLRASLYTSVVAFGVAAMATGLGAVLVLVGWALMRISRNLA